METKLIVLKQAPIISYEKIESVGKEVESRIADLNLENQIITSDTLSAAKTTRADLNKEFKAFEEQRKLIKSAVEQPYKEFENAYKEFIATHYNNADNILKGKISNFEKNLKDDKENRIRDYFQEASQSRGIDFITFERLNLNITLSTSDKSLRGNVDAFLDGIERDLNTLNSIPLGQEFKDNALFDYKKTLKMSEAIRQAQEREKAKAEAEKKRAEEANKQSKEQINEEPKAIEPLQAPSVETPITAPVDEVKLYETTFRVKGTMEQLKSLKQFITDNNIEILK